MSNYQHRYYHNHYKQSKKRANLALERDEYARFEEQAKAKGVSVNQCIRELALAQLDGMVPIPPEWEQWQQMVKSDLHRLGNEVHQLNLLYGEENHAPKVEEILEALFNHLQALNQKWERLYPPTQLDNTHDH